MKVAKACLLVLTVVVVPWCFLGCGDDAVPGVPSNPEARMSPPDQGDTAALEQPAAMEAPEGLDGSSASRSSPPYRTWITFSTPGTPSSAKLVSGATITVKAQLHASGDGASLIKDKTLWLRWYQGAMIQEMKQRTNRFGEVTFVDTVPYLSSGSKVDMYVEFAGTSNLKPSSRYKRWTIR